METKTAVNTYLEPADAEKLEALKDHLNVDKGATVVRILIRDTYDAIFSDKQKAKEVKEK